MNKTNLLRILFAIFFVTLSANAQISRYVIDVKTSPPIEKKPLSIRVELTYTTNVEKVILRHRNFGSTEFKVTEMLISGRNAVVSLSSNDVIPPYIEYYIEIRIAGGIIATFPEKNPEANPLKIQIQAIDPKDSEIRFLSPEEGEILTAEDLAIAVSLIFASDAVDKKNTRIFLDETDVTNEAIITDEVILYNPQNFGRAISIGAHFIRVELIDTLGNPYYTKKIGFNISTAKAIEQARETFRYLGNGQLEVRNENYEFSNRTYVRGDVRFNGTYRYLKFGTDVHLTNEEKEYLQPQNRFLATLEADEYAKIQVGDAYPVYPTLIVSGKRVRGISGSFKYSFLNLDISYGQTERKIEGTVIGDFKYDSSQVGSLPKESVIINDSIYRLFSSGTYRRNMFVVRPSFGSGENFQLGLTYLKAKDNMSSIFYGTYPKENLATAIDLLVAFDEQKIRWASQVAFSIENKDLSEGEYSDDDFKKFKLANAENAADSVKALEEAEDIINAAKIARKFITINSNLSPLNPFKGTPSLAYESEITLNYFNNFIRVLAFRRGFAYKSYGNDFIQNDIIGINISDRIRLLENRVMLSAAFETKHNNTQNDASLATTTYNTLNTSVTAYPGIDIPSFTVGYGFYTRKNPIDLSAYINTGKPLIMDIDTSRAFSWSSIQDNYTTIPWENARYVVNDFINRIYVAINHSFNLLGRQSAEISVNLAKKKDDTFYRRDQDNLNITFTTATQYDVPLQTMLSFIVSNNAVYSAMQDSLGAYLRVTQKQIFNYQTISVGARYRMLNNKLDLAALLAPSFGDFKRILLQVGADYEIADKHNLVSQIDFIQNSGKSSNIILSIIYRFNI